MKQEAKEGKEKMGTKTLEVQRRATRMLGQLIRPIKKFAEKLRWWWQQFGRIEWDIRLPVQRLFYFLLHHQKMKKIQLRAHNEEWNSFIGIPGYGYRFDGSR
mmetsp:Transcript_76574/g.153744  ORF Transcript_76574/g.153744 Transcript_76574/m.153744 type:complete len:102 (-) Transcript_76574:118-423(-)